MCQWRFLFGLEMLYSDVSGYSSFIPPCMRSSEHDHLIPSFCV